MIKARLTTGDGRPLLLAGLSHDNVRRLMDGQPIAFDAAELGVDAILVIHVGRTEADIEALLREHFVFTDEEGDDG